MLLKGRSAIIISIAVFAVFVIISNIFLAVLASAISYAFPVYLGHRKKKHL